MTLQAKTLPRHDGVSRRALLTGGLAGGFLLAFHLPLRAAVNEPVQPPDVTAGKFAPNAFIRIDADGQDHADDAAGRDGPGHLHRDRDDPRRGTRRRLFEGERSSTRRRTTSSTATRSSACRSPAIPTRSGRGGSRCATPAPARAPCWCRPRPRNGRSSRQAARPRRAKSSHAASGRKLGYGALAAAAGKPDAAQGRRRSRTPRISSDRQVAEAAGYA